MEDIIYKIHKYTKPNAECNKDELICLFNKCVEMEIVDNFNISTINDIMIKRVYHNNIICSKYGSNYGYTFKINDEYKPISIKNRICISTLPRGKIKLEFYKINIRITNHTSNANCSVKEMVKYIEENNYRLGRIYIAWRHESADYKKAKLLLDYASSSQYTNKKFKYFKYLEHDYVILNGIIDKYYKNTDIDRLYNLYTRFSSLNELIWGKIVERIERILAIPPKKC